MQLPKNELIAITGQNGAGKSTFVRCFCGLEKKFKGQTVIEEKQYKPKKMLRKCYLVMQDVNHQLFCESVEDEVLLGASDTGKEIKERAKEIMQNLVYGNFVINIRCHYPVVRNSVWLLHRLCLQKRRY